MFFKFPSRAVQLSCASDLSWTTEGRNKRKLQEEKYVTLLFSSHNFINLVATYYILCIKTKLLKEIKGKPVLEQHNHKFILDYISSMRNKHTHTYITKAFFTSRDKKSIRIYFQNK